MINQGNFIEIEVFITDRCNQKCPYCYAKDIKNYPGEMTRDDVKAIAEYLDNFEDISICIMGGEPTLHKELTTRIDDFYEFIPDVKLKLYTNLTADVSMYKGLMHSYPGMDLVASCHLQQVKDIDLLNWLHKASDLIALSEDRVECPIVVSGETFQRAVVLYGRVGKFLNMYMVPVCGEGIDPRDIYSKFDTLKIPTDEDVGAEIFDGAELSKNASFVFCEAMPAIYPNGDVFPCIAALEHGPIANVISKPERKLKIPHTCPFVKDCHDMFNTKILPYEINYGER